MRPELRGSHTQIRRVPLGHALARGAPVIILYMAVKHMARIAEKLIAGGRDPGEPVAFVSHAATDRQQVIETTLGQAAEAAAAVEPPAVIAIGPVVSLRPALDWMAAAKGERVLIPDPLGDRRTDEAV